MALQQRGLAYGQQRFVLIDDFKRRGLDGRRGRCAFGVVALQLHAHHHALCKPLVGKKGRRVNRDGALRFCVSGLPAGEGHGAAQQLLQREPGFLCRDRMGEDHGAPH